jgi:hypothetical protein
VLQGNQTETPELQAKHSNSEIIEAAGNAQIRLGEEKKSGTNEMGARA